MMLLAAAFVAGDAWTWSVALRYADAEGVVLDDRERWTVRLGKGGSVEAERRFVGTMLGDTLIPSEGKPETLKGRVGADGTFDLRGDWSDAAAGKALRRLLKPDPKKDEMLAGWPLVRRTTLREAEARLPGNDGGFSLRIEAVLEKARLGGRDVVGSSAPERAENTEGTMVGRPSLDVLPARRASSMNLGTRT